MIDINWNNFKAKFNGKETSTFENLSYQLFCSEFEINEGIFKFKNQTGIETEPITKGDDIIGFQSKFYDTKLSDNTSDLIDSVKKTKRENPDITKIHFYLNQEFSESSKKGVKSPSYKLNVEAVAKELNITLEWKVPSHFERQLALPKNDYLAHYFFGLDNNIIDFLNNVNEHTNRLLIPIQQYIEFNKQRIRIDRSDIVDKIENKTDDKGIVIVNGNGGCGKTAIVKELHIKCKDLTPFYVFKATEFNINNLQSFFGQYGNFTIKDFIDAHEGEKKKVIVIDSAEKISDLENQEPFKEFISAFIDNSWNLLFTTRSSYLDDLRFQFIEVFRLTFEQIDIDNLNESELVQLSSQFNFNLPSNSRLKKLIENPFYLNEYLKNYDNLSSSINYSQFKNILWSKKIQNSAYRKNNFHLDREECFLSLVKKRSSSGSFFVKPDDCLNQVLAALQTDEVIGYDDLNGGYFITHDIYEEWGLNLLIDRAYSASKDHTSFLSNIGTSLPIRRAFRNWLSDKLIDKIDDIQTLIEEIFLDDSLESFWKDELLVSILLSEYSNEFFNQFESLIIENDFSNLKRIVFLLRIGCKEVNTKTLGLLGLPKNLDYVFTKPKGTGWECAIRLIKDNLAFIKIEDLPFIIPLLEEWNSDFKQGETTKEVSQIALNFYNKVQADDGYHNDFEEKLVKIICNGASEVKDELANIFDEVLDKNWTRHGDPYYELCSAILEPKLVAIHVINTIPEHVLKLADKFWFNSKEIDDSPYYHSMEVEQYYSIDTSAKSEYFPASSYQTPIYWLLQCSLKSTVDFILNFTNKTIDNYAKSGFDKGLEQIDLVLNNGEKHTQFISSSLWGIYRGSGSPVTPYLLQSIHMALEKFFLETTKMSKSENIENWLIYLIKMSKSASITAVVTSVVLAFPERFFNVAKILFSSHRLFSYDKMRSTSEYQLKSLYSIGYDTSIQGQSFRNERIKTCDDSHRKDSLEELALKYQYFGSGTEEEFKKRQNTIWSIIDKFYQSLPKKKNDETDENKTIRLLLARIDRRKMKPTVERQGDNLLVSFNPQIDEDLKQHSIEATKEGVDSMKYSPLKLWSMQKLNDSKEYGDYEQYEKKPKQVLKETKEIIEHLKNAHNYSFHLFNASIPSYSCSTLIKHYANDLTKKEKVFCRETILMYATAPLRQNYEYQISDGVEVSVSVLPYLIDLFPKDADELSFIMLLVLFDTHPLGHYKRLCDYSIEAITSTLWDVSPDNAKKILLCFLKFKPLFNLLKFEEITLEESNDTVKRRRMVRQAQLIKEFTDEYENQIEAHLKSNIIIENVEIQKYPLEDLDTIFQLIPVKTNDKYLLSLISKILPVFAKKLLADRRDRKLAKQRDRSEDIDFALRRRIFKKYSYFILYRDLNSVDEYVKPFIDEYVNTDEMASFLEQILSTEDRINQYDQFWKVWRNFRQKIVDSSNGRNYYFNKIVHNYLLAWPHWREDAKNWRSLKNKEKQFFKDIVNDIGHHPSVFDSIAQFLNQIGSEFLSDGISWITELVIKNQNNQLKKNTIYYTEVLVRKYIYFNRTKVKQNIRTKNQILIILNFLITKSSVNAYLLREDIL
ncbi:AVAST type 4 anti-phage nuclease Avs4 [Maribacter flavus]|uniref:ATP-binding protein n=1 Tax=Maribacter flavus TaxID=1658664 RepID=A0A5B2TVI1_9FLAO|nr:AVAST type 4 anti-phage nuclease Avs4 [Maribacter flavus]KAA2218511.1 ATP-binding protein [Maribacter flavus]